MLIKQIARTTRLEEDALLHLSETADRRYKVYHIPKRGGGTRRIEHPSREIKSLQRWVARVIFARFPVHYAATAYQKGTGIRENAERHRRTSYTNRYDFLNFFPSFRQERVESFLLGAAEQVGMKLSAEDVRFVGNIVCRNGRITIGAPSSPAVTNSMMFAFDENLSDFCDTKGLIYTRYADDIFISAHEVNLLRNLEPRIADAKRDIPYFSLRLNRRKTTYLSKKYSRKITGVVITPDHRISIGRDRKREIKSLLHLWVLGQIAPDKVYYLRGLLAFARDIEPDFETSLRRKYGDAQVEQLLRHPDLGSSFDPGFRSLL